MGSIWSKQRLVLLIDFPSQNLQRAGASNIAFAQCHNLVNKKCRKKVYFSHYTKGVMKM